MHLKNVLRQINTDSCNIHRGRSHPRLSGCKHFHFGTLMPLRVGASIPLLSGRATLAISGGAQSAHHLLSMQARDEKR
jgi:hypothetical protein